MRPKERLSTSVVGELISVDSLNSPERVRGRERPVVGRIYAHQPSRLRPEDLSQGSTEAEPKQLVFRSLLDYDLDFHLEYK